MRVAVAARDKAGLQHFAIRVEIMVITLGGNQIVLLADPDGLVGNKLAVCLRVVVLALKLLQAVCELHAVHGHIELAVLGDDFLLAVFEVGHEHLAVLTVRELTLPLMPLLFLNFYNNEYNIYFLYTYTYLYISY